MSRFTADHLHLSNSMTTDRSVNSTHRLVKPSSLTHCGDSPNYQPSRNEKSGRAPRPKRQGFLATIHGVVFRFRLASVSLDKVYKVTGNMAVCERTIRIFATKKHQVKCLCQILRRFICSRCPGWQSVGKFCRCIGVGTAAIFRCPLEPQQGDQGVAKCCQILPGIAFLVWEASS